MLSFSPLLDLEECSFTARHDECANIKATLCKFFFFFFLSLCFLVWTGTTAVTHCTAVLHLDSCAGAAVMITLIKTQQVCSLQCQTPSKCNNNKKKTMQASKYIFFLPFQHQKMASFGACLASLFIFTKLLPSTKIQSEIYSCLPIFPGHSFS